METTEESALNELAEEIRCQFEGARNLYNRVVLVVGPAGTGKTAALRAICDGSGLPSSTIAASSAA